MSSSPYPLAVSQRPRTLGLVLAALPAIASAHPGEHGSDWLHAVMHLLSEPDHLAAGALALAFAVWGVRTLLRRRGAPSSTSSRRKR